MVSPQKQQSYMQRAQFHIAASLIEKVVMADVHTRPQTPSVQTPPTPVIIIIIIEKEENCILFFFNFSIY